MSLIIKFFIINSIFILNLFAHAFWVNVFSNKEQNYHTLNLGWGHKLPLDETLNSSNAKALLDEFNLINNNTKISLPLVLDKEAKLIKSEKSFSIYKSQNPTYKLSLNNKQNDNFIVEAKTKETFYTKYIDTKDRVRFKLKPKDKLKNVKKVLSSSKYQAFAKSYIKLKNWKKIKPLGHNLEIIPLSKLDNLKVGDMVEVKVLFEGKPLSMGESIEYITAYSDSFGEDKGFNLISYLVNGKAKFQIQSKGKWMIGCFHKEDVNKNKKLKYLKNKTNVVYNVATLTFDVK